MGVKITTQKTGNGTARMSHDGRVQFIDNTQAVLAQFNANKKAALTAMGIKAVGLIIKKMQSGYHTPHANRSHVTKYIRVFGQRLKNDAYKGGGTHTDIRDTGDLMRDVNYAVEASGTDTVDVGNSLEYAVFVHEGTSKLESRPYIKDAVMDGKGDLRSILTAYLKQGF